MPMNADTYDAVLWLRWKGKRVYRASVFYHSVNEQRVDAQQLREIAVLNGWRPGKPRPRRGHRTLH